MAYVPGGSSEDLRALLASWPTLSPWVSMGGVAEWEVGLHHQVLK